MPRERWLEKRKDEILPVRYFHVVFTLPHELNINSIAKCYFDQALKMTNGNECKAAKLLNLSRDRFRYRRKKLATVIVR